VRRNPKRDPVRRDPKRDPVVREPFRRDPMGRRADVAGTGKAAAHRRELTLVELVDRLLGAGVVIEGHITLTLADVDLIYLNLRIVLSSVESAIRHGLPVPGAGALGSGGLEGNPFYGAGTGPSTNSRATGPSTSGGALRGKATDTDLP
jgi:hypothetical protein